MVCVLSRSLIISDLTFWHFTVIYSDPSFNYIQLSLVTRSVLVNKHIKSRNLVNPVDSSVYCDIPDWNVATL